MSFFYQGGPAYKTGQAQPGAQVPAPRAGGGLLSGLLGGAGTPMYQTTGGTSSLGLVRCRPWWQLFPGTPPYRTAPPDTTPAPPDPGTGEGTPAPSDATAPLASDDETEDPAPCGGPEIHIW